MGRRQFTKELKLQVVQELESGLSLAEASRRYEVHPNLIRKWRELYRDNGDRAFAGHGKMYREEAKIAALERKIGQLTMENEFLKKLIEANRRLQKENGSNGK
ncbi:MAG: transposase [Ignavibacteriales bacterium]|nr:transposase [Ignavibacteriales bacterium]MBI3787360.1 transposase [Ignavibacteriales bacterium]